MRFYVPERSYLPGVIFSRLERVPLMGMVTRQGTRSGAFRFAGIRRVYACPVMV